MLQCPKCGRRYSSEVKVCPEDGSTLQADSTLATAIPVDPLIGRTLDDKYRLDARLGEGGMGTVYRATHLLIDRPVAIKVLKQRFVTDDAAQERFSREARAAGRLQHTNAVAVTDFGRSPDGLVYIVMELLEGRSLRDLLAREAPLDTARAVSLMLQITAAVAAAHEAGIIHRDLKPGNIFVVQRKHVPPIVKVLDFGIAKLATEADGREVKNITQAGVMIGTPRYMSPEQCDGAELTAASDVYSLGIILYEMLTGTTPFTGPSPLAVALKHSSERPRPPREFVPAIPQALEDLVLRALEKKPEARPSDAGAFRRELYQMAEKLGLEHSAGFSAPTIETLRDVGTETPSGRLVIDLEKMREKRASTTQAEGAVSTAEEKALETVGAAAIVDGEASKSTAPAAATSPNAKASGSIVAAPIAGRREAWLRLIKQPIAIALISLAALFLIITVIAIVATRSPQSSQAKSTDEADESIGRDPQEGGEARVAPEGEPQTAADFYDRGTYFFSVKNFDAAEKDFRRAVEMQSNYPQAHNRLGRALLMKRQFGEAAKEFRTAIDQKNGQYPTGYYNLGFALQLQGDASSALNSFYTAINQRGGNYPDAYYQIGSIQLELGRNKEAADALRKAIEQNGGRDPLANLKLGTALAIENDFAGAEQAIRAAIEQKGGDFPEAQKQLALMYEKSDRPKDAAREYRVYLEKHPDAFDRRMVEQKIKGLEQRGSRQTN
jgi:serine/threonine protein kinase/tetratricopeptide (TPR) repeat protein